MRLQLNARAALVLALALVAGAARGEDRVSVQGSYYRETSTRVVQPLVLVSKDLPNGFDAMAHGLVDAITSPSVLTGVQGDNIFTEYRKEAGIGVGKTIGHTHVGLTYKQSREPDYISHAAGLQLLRGVWDNSGTVALSLAYSHDTIGPNLDMTMQAYFASLSYTQALSPVLLAEVDYEATYLHGFLCNPYDLDKNGNRAACPPRRLRHVVVARLARYFPRLSGGVQLHYRFYYDQWPGSLDDQPGVASLAGHAPDDPWHMIPHTVEGRMYREMGAGIELRLSYRFHSQGAARFRWCSGNPSLGVQPGCEGIPVEAEHATDEKLTAFDTHIVELKLYWEARALGRVPVLAWFALGSFELSYAHYFQPTHYGDAHVLQTGYSLPF